ncbi:MAG TPA: hypothetical protein VMP01_07750 [Pirellulaceae bacterium]|nr:hypothetical protein [Pirellulaceae bacterium]
MFQTIIAFVAGLAIGLPAVANEELDPDIKELQGRWESSSTDGVRVVRMEKHVTGNRETVRIFVDDQLVRQHSVDISVERSGEVKVFRWKNGRIEAGAGVGERMANGACISRVRNDCWNCAFGMLDGDEQPVSVQIFRKMKEAPAKPAQ